MLPWPLLSYHAAPYTHFISYYVINDQCRSGSKGMGLWCFSCSISNLLLWKNFNRVGGQMWKNGLSLKNGHVCYLWGSMGANQEPKHIHPTACTPWRLLRPNKKNKVCYSHEWGVRSPLKGHSCEKMRIFLLQFLASVWTKTGSSQYKGLTSKWWWQKSFLFSFQAK